MAAVVLGINTPTTTDGPVTSDSFTPATGDLLVVLVTASSTADTTGTCVSSVGGQTYTQVATSLQGAAPNNLVVGFVADQPATAVSQTVTVDFPADASNGQVITVLRVSGMSRNGLAAVLQSSGTWDNAAVTPNVVFGAATLTTNPIVAILGANANPPTVSPPAGFDEHSDTGYATPTRGSETVSRDSGHTSATVTWGSTSSVQWVTLGLELDTTAPGVSTSANAGLAQGMGHI